MDKVESNEEALFVECNEAFIEIKEKSDPGTGSIIIGLIFMFFIPVILFAIIPIGPYFTWDGTCLCCGSILLGFAMLVVGSNESSAHRSRYNKAAQDLANAEELLLSKSREESNETKPQKIFL